MNAECRQNQARFSEYLDDALDEAGRDALEAHLESCERCRAELAALRRAVESVRELPVLRAPDGFAAGIRERLTARERTTDRRLVRLIWARALPVAAMFLLVVGATFLVSQNGLFKDRGRRRTMAMQRPERGVAGRRAVEKAVADEPERPAPSIAPMAEREQAAGSVLPVAESPAAMGVRLGGAAEADAALRHLTADMQGRARRHLQEEMEVRARQRLTFNQVPVEPPTARRTPQQVLDVTAERPTEILARTVAAANRRGVRAVVEVADDGTVDVYLDVPPEDYTDLLRELAGMTKPVHQNLRNTMAAEGAFFGDLLDRYSAYQNAAPGPAREGILRRELAGERVERAEMAAPRAPMESSIAAEERRKVSDERAPGPISLQVAIRPGSPPTGEGR
jgi:anti-sigma factor RsiW/acylphosphatase